MSHSTPLMLLKRLLHLQVQKKSSVYDKGMFPSQRHFAIFPFLQREDDNIFFTASILFILKRIQSLLTEEERKLIEEITQQARLNYPRYQQRNGRMEYNFYQTNPRKHYPNGWFFHKFKFFFIPEDADDTVLIFLTEKKSTEQIEALHAKLVAFANGSQKWSKHMPKPYRTLPAYATWFGSGVMPIDLDLCVMTNILYFVCAHELPFQVQDEATIEFIQKALDSGDYKKMPYWISPYYPTPLLILYHLSRLVSEFDIPAFNSLKEQLIRELKQLNRDGFTEIEQVLFAISWMRLTEKRMDIQDNKDTSMQEFSFFSAPMFKGIDTKLSFWLSKFPLLSAKYRSESFNVALKIEYLALNRALH